MPERNAPCPCGSGKKYKKCCGLSNARPPQADLIAVNRAVAYKGDIGRHRKAWCETYTLTKKEGLASVEAKLRDGVADQGKAITCHKGCTSCCDVYVFSDLQECENIVHYLYEHEDALQHFLREYPAWQAKIDKLGSGLGRIEKAQERVLFRTATEADQQAFNDGLNAYAALRSLCPFIKDGACVIYEVRPYVCAGVVSTNPCEYCSPGHPEHEKTLLVKADFQPQNDLPYFMHTKNGINFGCMPAFVYRILKYGYGFLSSIEGLEDMRRLAAEDPEIQKTLAWLGVASSGHPGA